MNDLLIYEAKQLSAKLGVSPLYVIDCCNTMHNLSQNEWNFAFSQTDSTVAFTLPVADLMFKNALRYEWQGRGACVIFRRGMLAMKKTEMLGIVIHELGHYVADGDRPERDDSDHGQAIQEHFRNLRSESEQHNRRWLRATVHLWSRACEAGYKIGFQQVVNLAQYNFSPKDLLPLLSEASQREGEPIEAILANPPPGAAATQQPVTAAPQTYFSTPQPRSQGITSFIGGQLLVSYPDGSIEVPGDLAGNAGKTFKSMKQLQKSIVGGRKKRERKNRSQSRILDPRLQLQF